MQTGVTSLFTMNTCKTCTYHKYSKQAEVVAFTDNSVQTSAKVGAPITDPVSFSICVEQEQIVSWFNATRFFLAIKNQCIYDFSLYKNKKTLKM